MVCTGQRERERHRGLYFFEKNVNCNSHLTLLEELRLALDEDSRFARQDIIYQQDAAPAYYGHAIREFLNEHFLGWIGRASHGV